MHFCRLYDTILMWSESSQITFFRHYYVRFEESKVFPVYMVKSNNENWNHEINIVVGTQQTQQKNIFLNATHLASC